MTTSDRLASVAVIGGGFCGAICAVHLLRDHPGLPIRLSVIEPRPVLGAGLAYSARDPQHRINVAAARMSPFVEDELHFDRWLRAEDVPGRDPDAGLPDGRLYAQRAEVGRYVDTLLHDAIAHRPEAAFRHVRERAVSVRQQNDGYAITLQGGAVCQADVVVLAVGHPPPALPAVLRPLAGDARLVADPWDEAALGAIAPDADVLIVGTGLTACDVVASLRARGHAGHLIAVSRRGLLPRPRTTLPVEAEGDFASAPSRTARDLVRRVRRAVDGVTGAGRPWENVIDALRRQGRDVWGALPSAERLRFLRHGRAFWDVHRFQAAPQVADAVSEAIAAGRLEVLAASLRAVEPDADDIRVRLHPRRAAPGQIIQQRVGAVVACVGPGHVSVVESNPALRSLAAQGLLRADPYGLGIAVDGEARCITTSGQPAEGLFVAGPLARGTDGELMGLPQVSTQPREVAGRVAGLLSTRSDPLASSRPPRAELLIEAAGR